MLAIFDSGLGGLTVLREVRALVPGIDLIYLADQAHVPYGDRTPEDLHELLIANVATLASLGASGIAMGCNTSCAIGERFGWPAALPILDLIDAAAGAVAASGARRIGVLATKATAASGAYGRAIRRLVPDALVIERGTSELVPLVEAGILDGPTADQAVARAIEPFDGAIDAIVLGCTHFPFLDAVVARAVGTDVRRFDPAVAQALRAREFARREALDHGRGRTRFITTGPRAPFAAALATIVDLGALDTIDSLEPVAN